MANRLIDYIGFIVRQAREEFVDRGWFGRNPAPANSFGRGTDDEKGPSIAIIDARQTNIGIHDASQRSLSITSGWDLPKDAARDRDGPDIER